MAGDLDGDGLPDFLLGSGAASFKGTAAAGQVLAYLGNDLYLHLDRHEAQAGDTVELQTGLGTFGQPTILFLERFNGVPLNRAEASGSIGFDQLWTVTGVIPPGFAGNELELRSYTLTANRAILDSGLELLRLR